MRVGQGVAPRTLRATCLTSSARKSELRLAMLSHIATHATQRQAPKAAVGRRNSSARRRGKVRGGNATRRPVSMVLTESMELEVGSRAPPFELLEPRTGETVSLQDFEGAPALLVMFICNHCPFVKMLKEEIKRVTDEYMGKGLSVVAISSNCVETKPLDSPEEMVKDCEEYGYNFPYLFDDTQEVAKAYKAACTPEFFVFSKSGRRPFQLEYHGQFDNARPSNDVRPTGADLRNALDYVLSGRKIDFIQKPSIGCNIKWKPGNEPEYFQG